MAQNPPDDNISWKILVGTIVSIVPATICVILRFVSRHVAKVELWWDDYTIAVALSFLAVQVLYFFNAVFTKASLLFLFHRIFGVVQVFRWALWITGFLVTAYFIACTIVAIAGCSPVAKFWDTDLQGSCINEVAFFRWNGVSNMILDFLVFCLPIPMVWRVKTTTRQKWILTGIFLLAGFVCLVSIVRIISFGGAEGSDPLHSNIGPATWSQVEQSVGIVCACLPTLRPLFKKLYGPTQASLDTGDSSVFDDHEMSVLPRRISHSDEEDSILGLAPSSSPRQNMLQNVDHSSTFTEDDDRPVSQSSQMHRMNRPASAAKSFA
ncbi:hypothetical protein N7475_010373 [Penicillium sp. IBT 31633x]|nr:hypothetical protein N7475_010373 [Penicillium sp. IBT 31633x]